MDLMTPLLANSWKKHTNGRQTVDEYSELVCDLVCDLVVTEGTLAKFQTPAPQGSN